MAHKKKHKRKKSKADGTLAFALGIVSQALGKILGDAMQVAVERLAGAQEKASRAIGKKKREAVDAGQAVAP